MPYEIIRSHINGKQGYRVKEIGKDKFFSKDPMPLDKAIKQRQAIEIAENKKRLHHYHQGIAYVPSNDKKIVGTNSFGDNVFAVLEKGEIVIPRKYAPKIRKILKEENIKLPGL